MSKLPRHLFYYSGPEQLAKDTGLTIEEALHAWENWNRDPQSESEVEAGILMERVMRELNTLLAEQMINDDLYKRLAYIYGIYTSEPRKRGMINFLSKLVTSATSSDELWYLLREARLEKSLLPEDYDDLEKLWRKYDEN